MLHFSFSFPTSRCVLVDLIFATRHRSEPVYWFVHFVGGPKYLHGSFGNYMRIYPKAKATRVPEPIIIMLFTRVRNYETEADRSSVGERGPGYGPSKHGSSIKLEPNRDNVIIISDIYFISKIYRRFDHFRLPAFCSQNQRYCYLANTLETTVQFIV